jgi:hypothetical protein
VGGVVGGVVGGEVGGGGGGGGGADGGAAGGLVAATTGAEGAAAGARRRVVLVLRRAVVGGGAGAGAGAGATAVAAGAEVVVVVEVDEVEVGSGAGRSTLTARTRVDPAGSEAVTRHPTTANRATAVRTRRPLRNRSSGVMRDSLRTARRMVRSPSETRPPVGTGSSAGVPMLSISVDLITGPSLVGA